MTTTNHLVYGWEIEGLGTYAESDASFGHFLRISTETMYEVAVNRLYVRGLADLPSKISTTYFLAMTLSQAEMRSLIAELQSKSSVLPLNLKALVFMSYARP